MAKFNPVKLGLQVAPIAVGGVLLYEGYFLLTDNEPFDIPLLGSDPLYGVLKPVVDNIKEMITALLGGGDGGDEECDLTCTAPQVLDGDTCTCVTPPAGCTTTCTLPQVLDVATCTCKTPVTNPPPTTGTCAGSHLSAYPTRTQESLCANWCNSADRCNRYCFCKDCTTGPCKTL